MQATQTLNQLAHAHQGTIVQAGHLHQPSVSHPKVTSHRKLPLPLSSALLELIRRYVPIDGISRSPWSIPVQSHPQGLLGVQNGSLEETLASSRSHDLKLANQKARCRFETINSPILLKTCDLLFARVFSEPPF